MIIVTCLVNNLGSWDDLVLDLEDEEVLLSERVVVETETYLVWIVPFSELLNVHEDSFTSYSLLRMCRFSESRVLLPWGLILIMELLYPLLLGCRSGHPRPIGSF